MSQSTKTSLAIGKLTVKKEFVNLGNTSRTPIFTSPTPSALATTTTLTLTTAQILSGIVTVNSAAADATHTTPTAAAIVAAVSGAVVGQSFQLTYINTSTSYQVTIAAGSGVTLVGDPVVLETANDGTKNASVRFLFRFTNVTSGAEAVSVYRV